MSCQPLTLSVTKWTSGFLQCIKDESSHRYCSHPFSIGIVLSSE
jgi:hypothetical protein